LPPLEFKEFQLTYGPPCPVAAHPVPKDWPACTSTLRFHFVWPGEHRQAAQLCPRAAL